MSNAFAQLCRVFFAANLVGNGGIKEAVAIWNALPQEGRDECKGIAKEPPLVQAKPTGQAAMDDNPPAAVSPCRSPIQAPAPDEAKSTVQDAKTERPPEAACPSPICPDPASFVTYSTAVKFGNYTVVQGQSFTGEGSYGQAVEVTDSSGHRRIMKLFRHQDQCFTEIRAYERISQTRSTLSSEAACPFLEMLGSWTVLALMWIALPKVPGGDVWSQLKDRVFQPEETVAIMHAAWCGLDFLHNSAKMLHLDIKPANMLWTHERLVIIDFSLWEPWPVPAERKCHSIYCTDGFRPLSFRLHG